MAYATPEAKIEAALVARLQTLTLTPAFAVAYPGVNFPAENKPPRYLRVEHDGIARMRPFLSTTTRQRGSLFVSVCMPKGTNSIDAMEIAGAVAAHFPADYKATVEGVTVRITERPTVAGGYVDETDQRWRTPVVIPYEVWLQAS